MRLYIKMKKLRENDNFVWYQFEADIPRENHLKGIETKYGEFKFDKINGARNEDSIELIKEKTDTYFFNKKEVKYICLYQMLKSKEKNDFTEVLEWIY